MPDPDHSLADRTAAGDFSDPSAEVESTATGFLTPPAETHGFAEPATAAPSPGEVVGRYRLLGELARGGMGVVYRASDPTLDREVAVKVLSDRLAARPDAARRFRDEARVTGQLQHPAVPPIHEAGDLPDGRPFLAMKLIKGQTLEALLADGGDKPRRSPGQFLAIFEQVCQAIAYAHSRDVIHRDLKPANVMVGSFGEVQVMDWGLAKVLGHADVEVTEPAGPATTEIRTLRDSDGSETQAGSVLGTPSFMPPEQAVGAVGKVDRRADVFGLGAILCVILTGKPPFVADTTEDVRILAAQGKVGDAVARLEACGAEPDLIALAVRCLAADPADRSANAGEVARAVADLRTAAEERARQAELDLVKAEGDKAAAELRAAEQWKRRKVQAALGLSFTGLVVLGGAFAWWAQDQRLAKENEARDRRAAEQREVSQAVEDAVAKFGRAHGAGRDPALWAEARAAALQAQVRATEADAPPEVHGHIRRLLADIEQLEKNRRLVATLLEIRAGMGDQLNIIGVQDFAGADARYRRAFRDYGADLFALSPEEGADLLRRLGSEVRVDLAAAIDDWAYVRYALTHQRLDDLARLFQVTRLLDPDPVRNGIRAIVVARDAAALDRLAEEIDPAVHPVQTVNLVAVYLFWLQPNGHRSAARFLHKAHPHHPGDFQINHNLAWFLLAEGRRGEALPYALAAIAVRPRSSAAWQDYLRSLPNTGRDAVVIAVQRRLCALSPGYVTIRFELAARLGKADDPAGAAAARADALRVSEEVLRAEPNNAPLHIGVGNILWDSNEKVRGEACYVAATRLDPKNPEAFATIGNARRLQGDLDGAIRAYRESVRLDPQNYLWHDWLALVLLQKGDGPAALAAAREAVRLNPTFAHGRYNLGRALQLTGDLDGAIAEYTEALRLNPKRTDVRTALDNANKLKAARDAQPREPAPPPRPAGG